MKYLVDIDGVLCRNGLPENYATAEPIAEKIEDVNAIFDKGNEVVLYTSRLSEDRAVTEKWLKDNGVKYSSIIFDKPTADYYIDDKALNFLPAHSAKLNRKKLAICISGGMDSYIAYFWAIKKLGYKKEDIICINFDIGHPYAKKEQEALKKLGIPYTTIHIDLLRESFGNMPTETKYVIPARNMIFSTIAAGFAERVWIMGMKFENHYLMYDKNDDFFRIASACLTQSIGSQTIVESPFIDYTKTDIIQWAVDNKLEKLHETTSCYHPKLHRCGECSLCFKRFVAMMACGVEEKFSSDPRKSEEAQRLVTVYKEAIRKNDFSHYQKDRILETFDIMGIKI